MGIGFGIFLIALGAIFTFAVDWTVGGLDLHAVGWILMAAGVGELLLFLYFWNRRRTPEAVATLRQRRSADAPRTYDDPTPPPATVIAATPQPPLPAQATTPQVPVATVIATAPVAASSQRRPDGQ